MGFCFSIGCCQVSLAKDQEEITLGIADSLGILMGFLMGMSLRNRNAHSTVIENTGEMEAGIRVMLLLVQEG